jgi:hypothetical protein
MMTCPLMRSPPVLTATFTPPWRDRAAEHCQTNSGRHNSLSSPFVGELLWAELPAHAKLDWPFIFARTTCLPDSGRYDGSTDHDQNSQQAHRFPLSIGAMRRMSLSVFGAALTPLLETIPASCKKSDLLEFAFGPEPIVKFLAGVGAALEIDLVGAKPNLVLSWPLTHGCFFCLL